MVNNAPQNSKYSSTFSTIFFQREGLAVSKHQLFLLLVVVLITAPRGAEAKIYLVGFSGIKRKVFCDHVVSIGYRRLSAPLLLDDSGTGMRCVPLSTNAGVHSF